MKYIILHIESGDQEREVPIIFPDLFIHEEVYKALVRSQDPKDYNRIVGVISAGFVNSIEMNPNCHGESTTLKVKSRGEKDSALIRMFDYLHGLKTDD